MLYAMVKYGFNARWRERDAADSNMLLRVLFPMTEAFCGCRRKKGEACQAKPGEGHGPPGCQAGLPCNI